MDEDEVESARLSSEAEAALRAGFDDEARDLFRQAARVKAQLAFDAPTARLRHTLGVSAISLLLKAGNGGDGALLALNLLALDDAELAAARAEVERLTAELAEVMRDRGSARAELSSLRVESLQCEYELTAEVERARTWARRWKALARQSQRPTDDDR